jgi:AcrR family transcriptional regulator
MSVSGVHLNSSEPESAVRTRINDAALRLFAERGTARVTVKDLASYAGVARGTVYAHAPSPEALFGEVAAGLSAEMNARVSRTFETLDDPVARLAFGIRAYVRRAHEESAWGRFMVAFAHQAPALQEFWNGAPMQDVLAARGRGRFAFDLAQRASVLTMVCGTTLGALRLVLDGHETWRSAGSAAAEFVLRALGIAPAEARAYATAELPPLAPEE